MARAKRTTLPPDFAERLRTDSLRDLIGLFERCAPDARDRFSGSTAIGFADCPDELVRWLVAHGADVDARDRYGTTPLQRRASGWRPAQLGLLLELGAGLETPDHDGHTALERAAAAHRPAAVRLLLDAGARIRDADDEEPTLLRALRMTENASIAPMAEVALQLTGAGAAITAAMREEVARIGTRFEFHRSGFRPEGIADADAGLATLYGLFGVPAAPDRVEHDGVARIEVPDGPWQRRYHTLWELLVPSSGPASVVQGEVVRIAGRVSREILDNGGGNWDAEFGMMLQALEQHVGTGTPLGAEEQHEVHRLVRALRRGRGQREQLLRLTELAVEWATRNPDPIPLPAPAYRR